MAQTTWTLSTGPVTSGGVTVSTTAWANTVGSGADANLYTLENQAGSGTGLALYGGGLGIKNKDFCSTSGCTGDYNEGVDPEHSIDNNQRYEMALLSFSQQVNLTGFNIGWRSNDSDMTLLVYTGAGSPTLTGLRWDQLVANGWSIVSHYGAVPVGAAPGVAPTATGSAAISSFWLIGAFNNLVGTSSCLVGGYCGAGSPDYVKLLSVTGSVRPPETPGVPEPGSLALLGLALVGLLSVSRRRNA